jgi:hypothetical protein
MGMVFFVTGYTGLIVEETSCTPRLRWTARFFWWRASLKLLKWCVLWLFLKTSARTCWRMTTEWSMWSGLPAHDRETWWMLPGNRRVKKGADEWNSYFLEEESKQLTETSDHYRLFFKAMSVVWLKIWSDLWSSVNAPNKIFWITLFFLLFMHLLPFISLDNQEFTMLSLIYHWGIWRRVEFLCVFYYFFLICISFI